MAEFKRTGDDEADAASVRTKFLERTNPAEYQCYLEEQHPVKRKEIFARAFMIAAAMANGERLPDEAFVPSCKASNDREAGGLGVLATNARAFFVQGLKQMLREAIRTPGPVNAGAVAESLYGAIATGNDGPQIDSEALAKLRTQAGADLVRTFVSVEAGESFPLDPPMVRA